MILDERLEFADATSVIGATGTNLIGDQIDLSTTSRDIGTGEPMYWVIQVTTAIVGTTSTVNFRLRSDDTASIHATTSTPHLETGAIAEATLVAGWTWWAALPGAQDYERYLGIQAVVAVNDLTAGAINSFLTHDVKRWKAYADAVN